jgi:hypothetical protein
VVAVRVNFLNLFEFVEVVSFNDVVDKLLFSPINEILEHQHNIGKHKLSRSTKTQVVVIVVLLGVNDSGCFDPVLELS